MSETRSLNKYQFLSGSVLKLIAMITMLMDHIGYVFGAFPVFRTPLFTVFDTTVTLYFILRKIGRLAFPIYCFLIGEGLRHTRSQFKYLLRLLIFAALSEIPFNLMISGQLRCHTHQNVFFTLFLGAAAICIYRSKLKALPKAALMLLILGVSTILDADYGTAGMVAILLIYALRGHTIVQALAGYPLFSGGVYAIAAFIPISMYSGKRGFVKGNFLKTAFYLFYPLHIALLVTIKRLIIKGVI